MKQVFAENSMWPNFFCTYKLAQGKKQTVKRICQDSANFQNRVRVSLAFTSTSRRSVLPNFLCVLTLYAVADYFFHIPLIQQFRHSYLNVV